jgi:hypothetical protein
MDIAPIAGIGTISLLNVKRAENALVPPLEVEATVRTDDEAHSSSNQAPEPELEKQEADGAKDELPELTKEAEPEILSPETESEDRISYFA